MNYEFDFGRNTLDSMITKGLQEMKSDCLDCMAYNINLDFVLSLFQKYPSLSKINLYSNSQNMNFSPSKRKDIYELIEKNKIEVHHISANDNVIHAKLYRFWKDGKILFGAIGSPNFTKNSNLNFESILYIYDCTLIDKIWDTIKKTYADYNINEKTNVPDKILTVDTSLTVIDEKYLKDLWAHQKSIVEWMVKRNNSIINVPTGSGKTKIALSYLKYLFNTTDNITAIILVPTKTLIEQWMNILNENDIQCYELGVNPNGLGEYIASPNKKILVTLYSRFFDSYNQFLSRMRIVKPNFLLICDECHNIYNHLNNFEDLNSNLSQNFPNVFNVGLSATIDSFQKEQVERYITLMGGDENKYEISLPSFYSNWNELNDFPCLKPIKYVPIKYCLSHEEMEEYQKLSRNVGMQSNMKAYNGSVDYSAAIKRAMWVRNLIGGYSKLKEYINSHIESFNDENTIIFVPTHDIAENLRKYMVSHAGWNKKSSSYVYDSKRSDKYKQYALEQFRNNIGFCLISEIMLSEGFDIPKISRVILHGSHKSQRDWIQKIGRGLRYDQEEPNSLAEVIDVVFCDHDGNPLPIEKERYDILKSISE